MRSLLATITLMAVSMAGCSNPSPKNPKSEPVKETASKPIEKGSPEFWDNAYDRDAYVYGTEPNEFFASIVTPLPKGRLLLPGEGEGRNAVWAASQGWTVDAFDFSPQAKKKADTLAQKNGVDVNYWVADFAAPGLEKSYDVIAIVYLHLPSDIFTPGMKRMVDALKPGGTLVMEVFAEGHETTGAKFGPKTADVLYSIEEVRAAISPLNVTSLEVVDITLDEGMHQGPAKVLRLVATK